MKGDLTWRELETLRYRKRRLEYKAGQVEKLLSGRKTSLRPLLQTAGGQYSEEKTRALADKLVDSLDLFLRSSRCRGQKDFPVSKLPPALEEKEAEFFRSYLYCLLRMVECPPPWFLDSRGSFEDLLEMSRDLLEYKEKSVFYLDTVYRQVCASQAWLWMDRAWEVFSGKKMEDTISGEELLEMEKLYPSEIAAAAEEAGRMRELDSDPEYLELYADPDDTWAREERNKSEEKELAWLESFPEKERFCREYLRWRRDYFDLRIWNRLEEWITAMTDVYLYQEGDSSVLNDETYFFAYALLNRTIKQLEEMLSERE